VADDATASPGGLLPGKGDSRVLSLFTSPKPFRDHVGVIQRNALRSWRELGSEVEVLLIGDEEGMADEAAQWGARHLPEVERNELGTPLVSSIFEIARRVARHSHLCYVNSDVILLPDLLQAVRQVAGCFDRYLLVGRRIDLEVPGPLAEGPGWEQELREAIRSRGELHPPTGSDYFVFPRSMFSALPPFALGRAGWDNWMIYAGRHDRVPVVDGTGAVTAVHQAHDYAHLPGGRPHFRLPESRDNVEMGGGRVTVFTIRDATWQFGSAGLERRGWREAGVARNLEAALYSAMGAGRAARAARMLLHPYDTVRYYYWAARRRAGRILKRRPAQETRR